MSYGIVKEADAQIAALTERLRAVEAERDEARSHEADANFCFKAEVAKVSALRAELARKDAALGWYAETVGKCANFDIVPGGTEARAALAKDIGARARAALQPKDKPCQTA